MPNASETPQRKNLDRFRSGIHHPAQCPSYFLRIVAIFFPAPAPLSSDKGLSGIAGSTEIDAITQTLNLADSSMGSLLMQVADFTADETSLEKRKNRVMSLLNHYRELGKKKLEGDLSLKAALDALAGRQIVKDNFGLTYPDEPQKEPTNQ
jgi:hypothetical protein